MAVQKCDECGKSAKELYSTYQNRELLLDYWYCDKCFKKKFPDIEDAMEELHIPSGFDGETKVIRKGKK